MGSNVFAEFWPGVRKLAFFAGTAAPVWRRRRTRRR
jgi:hypothetical protein